MGFGCWLLGSREARFQQSYLEVAVGGFDLGSFRYRCVVVDVDDVRAGVIAGDVVVVAVLLGQGE